ncbi:MAG: hypothetical protein GQF41_4370 [Candidatus Rifleibacterium amylolyticum]|nr:MAG: hypothetical protein GQF41_4370 [Candidatus Rifleibacterium amylolyticum]
MKRSYGLTVLLLTAFLYFNLQVSGESLPELENASETTQVQAVANATVVPEIGPETTEDIPDSEVSEDSPDESADSKENSEIDTAEEPGEGYAETNEKADSDTGALTEPDVETDIKVQSASEAGDADIKLTDDTGDTEVDTATETEPEAELEAPDPFAAEPYAQSSLKDIEEYFISNHELAEKSAEFSERALAIIAGSSEDRNFRRQCEFLTRAANHNVYAAGLALIVMPRLLEVSNLVVENSIKTLMNTFTDELISEPLARGIRLSELGNHLNSQAELAKLLRQLSVKIDDFCDQTELQNSRRHVQGRIPEFLRAVNRDMVVLIRQQREQLDRLLNQLDQHLKFCQINLEYFLAVSDHAPAVMQGSQIGRILRSCLDFAVSLRNYRKEYEAFAYRYSALIKARLTDIEKLVGSNSRRNARIAAFTGNFPVRDRDEMPEKDFSAVETLQQTLRLLDAMREQSDRLMRDESSSISADNPIAPEAFEQLKSELSRHLNSTSWPIKKLIELKEPVYYESESPLATDVADVENN